MPRFLFCGLLLALLACWLAPPAGAGSAADIPFVALESAGDSFVMGDGPLGPNVRIGFTYGFAIARFPITNAQFAMFVEEGGYAERRYWTANGWSWKGSKSQPAFWTDPKLNQPDQPVVGVSWYEATAFCNWLSLKEGLTPVYDGSGRADLAASGYRLPTEAEWEYAAAKGAPGLEERIYPWGDAWDPGNTVSRMAPAAATGIASVGSKSPQGDTPQGVADMSGNVWEWCSDNAQSDEGVAASPGPDRYCFRGDSSFEHMVLRGGSWVNTFQNGFRAAFRGFSSPPGSRHKVSGFRIVRR